MGRLPDDDLAHVLEHTPDVWKSMHGARVFITGASGFVGSWMLETLNHADVALGLNVRVHALVRDRAAFERRLPHLAASKSLTLETGDVRFVNPPPQAFTHFVHCASASSPALNAERPDEVVDIVERGSEQIIAAAERSANVRFLQVSSGSVYGAQPAGVERLSEESGLCADAADPTQRFGAAKLRAERRGERAAANGLGFVSARIFALVGPRLPLDGQFALGQFLGDAVAGRPVHLTGDGTPVRSWLYAADMAAWCWTLLVRGRAGAAYNVGSEEALSLWDAAQRVAALAPPVRAERAHQPTPGMNASRFVPSVERARSELGLDAWIPFDESVRRTLRWARQERAAA